MAPLDLLEASSHLNLQRVAAAIGKDVGSASHITCPSIAPVQGRVRSGGLESPCGCSTAGLPEPSFGDGGAPKQAAVTERSGMC